MGWKLGASVAVLAALTMSGTAMAGRKCARPPEVTAIQVAAIQQELMVAALTCNDVASFNAFQTGYSKELRRSDWRLHHMFRRLFGGVGTKQYHAFKTRLANNSSIRSIRDNASFCKEAGLVFAAALSADKPSLADFVSGVAVHDDSPVDSCDIRVATGLAGARAVPNIVPKPNPLRVAALVPAAPAPVTTAGVAPPPAPPPGNAPVPGTPQVAAAPAAGSPTLEAAATPAATAQAGAPAAQVLPAQQAKAAPAKPKKDKKSSGWFSGIFD